MNIEKIKKILKGQRADNAHGMITIQHNSEAEKIAKRGYALINCSKAHTRDARVDYIEDGQFRTTGVISETRANWFIKIKFEGFHKILKKESYNVAEILKNLETNGYTGMYICVQIAKGNKPNADKVASMRTASARHLLTDYDEIDKKGMTDYEVRDLRRSANLNL